MNRKRLTAVILAAGLVLGGASMSHTTSSNNQVLLANNHSSKLESNQASENEHTLTQVSTKKQVSTEASKTKVEQTNSKPIEHKKVNTQHIQNTELTHKKEGQAIVTPKKTTTTNVNEALALNANTNIQIAYIGGGNNSEMNSNSQNSYSFAAVNPNGNTASNETNANVAPKTISNAPLTFASPLQKKLYEYLSVPANQALTMQTAINLHDGNPADTCVFFQSSALRANGFNIPLSTSYTTEFMGNLLESGWQRHTDFNNLQPGDICFASTYHTFMFMGWYNKAKKIAYVMGNESYMDSANYRERHIKGQTAAAANGYNEQYRATCYYTYNGTPSKHLILSGEIIGGTTNVMSESNGNGSVVGQVYYGDNVAILEQKGHYYKIDNNGLIGWVYAVDILPNGILNNYTTPKTTPVNHNTNTGNSITNVNTSNKGETIEVTSPVGLWLLGSPAMQNSKITVMPYNTKLEVLGQSGNWTEVNYNGTIGWCYTQYTKVISSAKPVVKPTKPVVHPSKPVVKPAKPVVHPSKPVVKPAKPVVRPNKPVVKPAKPVVHPNKPVVKPAKPVVHPNKPVVKPAKPVVHPNKPVNNGIIGTTTITSPVGLWQLSSPSMQGSHITVIPYNTKVNVYGEKNGWYEVEYNGVKGWSYATYTSGIATSTNTPVSHTTTKTTATVNSNIGLWLLNAPSMQGGHITVMPYNSNLIVLGHNGNWTKVNYNGTIGWCYTEYTTQTTTSTPTINQPISRPTQPSNTNSSIGTTTITSDIGLWQLSSPSMQGGHITVIPYNTTVKVFGERNGWYEVEYNGVKGWSYAAYTSGLSSNSSNTNSQENMKQVTSPVGLWLLQSPYLSAGKIEIMPYKANLKVLAQNGSWTKVNYNGTEGWCYTQYTKNI